jgi:chromosome segregation ATPase
MKQVSDRAASLAQKITDARTSLMLLRQRHPQPRLTIPLAEKKLGDQVTEMQTLNDEVQEIKQQTKAEKERVKSYALEVENIRTEATEAQKAVNMLNLEEDDSRLLPLYDWSVCLCHLLRTGHRLSVYRLITSRQLHQSLCSPLDNS